MATVAELLNVQQNIIRKTIMSEAVTAAAQGVTVEDYEVQMLARAQQSTIPALIVYEYIIGVTQSSALLDTGAAQMQLQWESYVSKGVLNPELGPYEAMGLALAETAQFSAMSAGRTDIQFVQQQYNTIFAEAIGNGTLSQAQVAAGIQHFLDQVAYFKGIYTAAGTPAATAELWARGAVTGQMVGVASTDLSLGLNYNAQAQAFLLNAVDGLAVYGASFEDQPGAPPVNETFFLTTGQDTAANGFQGGDGDDTFNATQATLTTGDAPDGGAGQNQFNYTTSGNGSVVESGFATHNIQTWEVTIDNGGLGTSMDLSAVTELDTLRNINSSNDLLLNNVTSVFNLEIVTPSTPHVASGTGTVNTTINYTAAATAGTTQNILLQDVFNPFLGPGLNNSVTSIFINGVNGVEEVVLTTAGTGASSLVNLVVQGMNDLVLDGDSTQGLFFQNNVNLVGAGSSVTNASNQFITFAPGTGIVSNSSLTATTGGGLFTGNLTSTGGPITLNVGSVGYVGAILTAGGAILIQPQSGGATTGSLNGSATSNGGNITINGGINGGIGTSAANPFVVNDGGGISTVVGGTANDFLGFQTNGFNVGDTYDGAGGRNQINVSSDLLGGLGQNIHVVNVNSGTFGDNWAGNLVAAPANPTGLLASANKAAASADAINFANFGALGAYVLDTVNVNTVVLDPTFLNLNTNAVLGPLGQTMTVNVNAASAVLLAPGATQDTFSFDWNGSPLNGTQTLNLNVTSVNNDALQVQDFDNTAIGREDPIGILNLSARGTNGLTVDFNNLNAMHTLGLDNVPGAAASTTGITIGNFTSGGQSVITVAGANFNQNANLTNLAPLLNTVNGAVAGGFATSITLGNGANTIVGAVGNDLITVGNGANNINGMGGNDTINVGSGGNTVTGGLGLDTININHSATNNSNTIVYNSVFESFGPVTDVINGFRSNVDVISLLTALQGVNPNITTPLDLIFWGNVGSTAAAMTTLLAFGGNGLPQAVYDQSTNTLIIDGNGDGLITGLPNDMTIIVNTEGDVGLTAQDVGTQNANIFLAAVGPFQVADATDNVFGTAATGAGPHLVIATAAQLVGSSFVGLGNSGAGTNILAVTTQVPAGFDFNTVLGLNGGVDLDLLELRAGSSAAAPPVIAPNINGLTINLGAPDDLQTGDNTGFNTFFYGMTVNGSSGDDDIFVANVNDTIFGRGGQDDITVNAMGGFTFVGTLNGGGNAGDHIALVNGSNIGAAATITGFDTVSMTGGGSVITLAREVNQQFANGAVFLNENYGGAQTVIITNAQGGTVTGLTTGNGIFDTFVDNYLLQATASGATTFVVADDILGAGQNVTDNAGTSAGQSILAMTVQVGPGVDPGGTFTADGSGTPNDNLEFLTGQATYDINGGNTLALNGAWNQLILGNNVSLNLNNAQHGVFVSANGALVNTLTLENAFSGTTFNTIENYVLNSVAGTHNFTIGGSSQFVNNLDGTDGQSVVIQTGLANVRYDSAAGAVTTVTIGGSTTGLDINLSTDNDIVNLSGSGSTGDINVGTGNNTLVFSSGDFSGLTFTTFGDAATDIANFPGVSFTFTAAQYNQIMDNGFVDVTGLAGFETFTISTGGNVNFTNSDAVDGIGEFGNLVRAVASTTTLIDDNAGDATNSHNLTLQAAGTDTVRINNVAFQAGDNDDFFVINGFSAANDVFTLQLGGVANPSFQAITAADTGLSIAANGVVTINSSLVQLIDGTNIAAIEAGLAFAIGATNAVGTDNFFAVMNDVNGDQWIYNVDVIASPLNGVADLDVEVIGQVVGVGLNGLTGANFTV